MRTFEIDFKYTVEEEGYEVITADDQADAEAKALKSIMDFYPEAQNVEILEVREVNG